MSKFKCFDNGMAYTEMSAKPPHKGVEKCSVGSSARVSSRAEDEKDKTSRSVVATIPVC